MTYCHNCFLSVIKTKKRIELWGCNKLKEDKKIYEHKHLAHNFSTAPHTRVEQQTEKSNPIFDSYCFVDIFAAAWDSPTLSDIRLFKQR